MCESGRSKFSYKVHFGDHTRTILTGMKQQREDPRKIEGKQALFVGKLAGKEDRDLVSEGMLFDIGCDDGVTPAIATPESPVPNGRRAG